MIHVHPLLLSLSETIDESETNPKINSISENDGIRAYFSLLPPQIVYCCWLAFELFFCYMFIIETKGLSLEETSALFDGENAIDQIHARGRPAGDEKDTKEFISEN